MIMFRQLFIRLALVNPFPTVSADDQSVTKIVSLALGVIAAVTVIFIIISALRYTTSLGDPQATARARNSIIYASIGLAVVVSAEVIVAFVLGHL